MFKHRQFFALNRVLNRVLNRFWPLRLRSLAPVTSPVTLIALSLLALPVALPGGRWSAVAEAADTNNAQTRRWKVIVLVPERHIAQPHIPDPAVETKISQLLIDAGYKVIDQERVKELRYSEVMDRIRRGGPQADEEVKQLQRRFGADLLLTGEAFTQEVSRQTVETDLGPVLQIRCRSRVELRGIRMETAEKFYADALQKTGSPEPTVELASKACLSETAADMGPALLAKIAKLALSKGQYITLIARNVANATQASQLEAALARLQGVLDVTPGDYDAHTDEIELYVDKEVVRGFAERLETTPNLQRFGMKVQSSNGSKIIVNCK